MALTATVATALACVFAAFAVGGAGAGPLLVPAALLALALVPSVVLVARFPSRRVLPEGRDARLLVWVTGLAVLTAYVTIREVTPDLLVALARLAILAAVPLSWLWPAPAVLGYCLLLAGASLAAANAALPEATIAILGVTAAAAVALIALKRLSTAGVRRLGRETLFSPRRLEGEAATLFAVAALVGLLVAALLPSPSRGGPPSAGEAAATPRPEDPLWLNDPQRLDSAARGSGKGKQVLFRVSAPGPSRWRAATYDFFDGRTWSRSQGLTVPDELASVIGYLVPIVEVGSGDTVRGQELFTQRVQVEAPAAAALPAAPRPVYLWGPEGRVRADRDGTIRAVPPLGRGATYVINSIRPGPGEDELRASQHPDGERPQDLLDFYLQLPPLRAAVQQLAVSITSTGGTAYDSVRAIQGWLGENTRMLNGASPLAAGADPLERFLLIDRRGSPEQAASAMAVLLRVLGVPARVVTGFLAGDRSPLGGDFVVRGRHATVWVEVWFPGLGWVGFDPVGRPFDAAGGRSATGYLWWLLPAVLAAAGWLAYRAVRAWHRRRARPWATRCYERVLRMGRTWGRPRQPHETPAEYCAALAEAVPDERLTDVGALVTAGAFSSREPPAQSRAWADEVVDEATQRRRRLRRQRLGPE